MEELLRFKITDNFFERENRVLLLSDTIDMWDEKYNKDLYGNRAHIFNSYKVSYDIIDKYYDNLNNSSDKPLKIVMKDGSVKDLSEQKKASHQFAVNSFVMGEDDFENNVMEQLKNINNSLLKIFKLLEDKNV